MQLRSIADEAALKQLGQDLKLIEERQRDPERRARLGPNWNDLASIHQCWGRFLYLGDKLRRLKADPGDLIPTQSLQNWDRLIADLADVEAICKLGEMEATRYVRERLISLMGTTDIADKPTAKRKRGGVGRGSQSLSRTFFA